MDSAASSRLRRSDVRKGSVFPTVWNKNLEAPPHFVSMLTVSKNNPFYFITSVTHHRRPVFRTDKLKEIICGALDEARSSGGFLIFAYAIMPEHSHIVTSSKLNQSDSLRYLNGISARRVIGHLKDSGYNESLAKLLTRKFIIANKRLKMNLSIC